MPDGIIVFDPLTGSGTVTRPDGTEYIADVDQFTSGRLYISNGFLVDSLDPLNNISLGRQGPASLTPLLGGRYSVISQTKQGLANATAAGDLLRSVEGTVSVTLAGGDIQTYKIDPIPVAGVGAQWIARAKEDGTWEYFTDIGNFRNNADVQLRLGVNYRLATPEESAYAAIMKQVINDSTGKLQEIIEEYGLESDSTATAEYKAAAIVMGQLDFTSVQVFSSHLIDAA